MKPYRRFSPLTPVVRSFIFVAAAVVTTWRELLRGDLGPFGWILLGLLVAGAVFGAASWLRTKYWIESDELRVDTGVVSRQSRRIRIDRLQGIDIVQPFVARLFGLAELRMDVAGGGAREGSLAFLTLSDARALKDLLLARRDAVRAAATNVVTSAEDASDVTSRPFERDRVLARVDLGMLLASIALSFETVVLLLIMSGIAIGYAATFLGTGQWGGFSATLPLLGGILLFQFRKLAGNYRFTVSQTPAGMQVRRGLFELSSQTIALPRLQGIVISEPLLWRTMNWHRLDVSIAGYSSSSDSDGGPAASTVLPVGHRTLVRWLARYMLADMDAAPCELTAPPARARWVAPVGRHFMGVGLSERVVVSREGVFTRRTHVVPHARVQSLRVTQGPWQRRLGLADFHVDSPPGPVNVRAKHRYAAEARELLERESVISRQVRRLVAGQDSGESSPDVAETIQ